MAQISFFFSTAFLLPLIVGALISSVAVAKSDTITGEPRVIDGDTIEVSGQKIRIHGVDAPESRQTCQKGGMEWLCGQEASKAMRAIVGRSKVACEAIDTDRYGRIVGRCVADGRDIGNVSITSPVGNITQERKLARTKASDISVLKMMQQQRDGEDLKGSLNISRQEKYLNRL